MQPTPSILVPLLAATLATPLLARRRRHRAGFLAANVAEGTREFDSLVPDAAVPTRYLLVKRGSDAAHCAVAGTGDRPIGVCEDQTSTAGVPLPGMPLRVSRLGISTRSRKVAVAGTVAQDDFLVPAANGYAQTLPTAPGTYWVIGTAEQGGTAGIIEFIGCLPYKVVVP